MFSTEFIQICTLLSTLPNTQNIQNTQFIALSATISHLHSLGFLKKIRAQCGNLAAEVLALHVPESHMGTVANQGGPASHPAPCLWPGSEPADEGPSSLSPPFCISGFAIKVIT